MSDGTLLTTWTKFAQLQRVDYAGRVCPAIQLRPLTQQRALILLLRQRRPASMVRHWGLLGHIVTFSAPPPLA